MGRPSLLVPALAIVALLLAVPGATAATNPEPDPAAIEFALEADNGMFVNVEGFDESITLSIGNIGSVVAYGVEGESTEAGLKAQFGKLGLVDVTFEPTKTLENSKPPKQCKGEPWTSREGRFVGTIQFAGEREYVRVDATRAKGRMDVTPEWQCPGGGWRAHLPDAPPPKPRARPEAKPDIATLTARSRQCRCGLVTFALLGRKGKGSSFFFGSQIENREGMEIERGTYTKAAPAAFTFNHKAGTARLDPPHPFTGTATFKRRPGRDLWRSTLRVPLLGADPLSLRGGGFRARLARDLPGD
jgi:hypothetical protein